jgi:hypothetical protein
MHLPFWMLDVIRARLRAKAVQPTRHSQILLEG